MKKINIAEMYVDNDIKQAVLDVLDSGHYIKGQNNKYFEKEFADFCGTNYAITTSSGTAAIFLSLQALGISNGDEVIVPSHTFIATVSPVLYLGAKPIFVDINIETYTINPEEVEKKISRRTKAIIPVHLYGHPADMSAIMDIANDNDIRVIEDACQAHGALYNGKKVGAIGDIGCFSFFPSKNMTVAGDGGMITTNDDELAEKTGMLRDQGRKEKYIHELLGFNFRLSEIHAAVGRQQLKHLPKWIEVRREIANYYNELFDDIDKIITPTEKVGVKHVYHLYIIRTKYRDMLKEYLEKQGISAGIHYPVPVHRQPCVTERVDPIMDLIGTDKVVGEVLSIPMHPQLKREEVEYITGKIKDFFEVM
jgi:perosamine synthetase